MIDTNYRIEALEYLLEKDCLSERYYPLIGYKAELILRCRRLGYRAKSDILALSDSELEEFGFHDVGMLTLLRRFLTMYDPNPQKFREIEKLGMEPEMESVFRELYYLPGVRHIRALLYFYSGYRSLAAIAGADTEDILEKAALAISMHQLSCIVPLPKEVRTHIAVARAFTQCGKE